jgi:hypothetical protein
LREALSPRKTHFNDGNFLMIHSVPFGALAQLSVLVVLACHGPPGDAPGEEPAAPRTEAQEVTAGSSFFRDVSATHLPGGILDGPSMDAAVADIDGDGDLDITTGNSDTDLSQRRIAPALFRAYLNDGSGRFTEATLQVFGEGVTGTGLDLEFGDFDGDGLEDVYLASRGTADRLLLRVR